MCQKYLKFLVVCNECDAGECEANFNSDSPFHSSKGIHIRVYKQSKIQEEVLPLLLADPPQSIIVQSRSGTGNTVAFVLAMLARVDASRHYPQMLCLSPTEESAQQTARALQQMTQNSPEIQMKLVVFGSKRTSERSNQRITEHIIIGTAGTILDCAVRYRVFDPKLINMFVLDEADIMIDTQGQQDQAIRLRKLLRTDCQHVLFSVTCSKEVMSFANKIILDPDVIRLRRLEESLDNIKQYYVQCRAGDEEKFAALTNIYGVLTIGQCIVSCCTSGSAIWLADKMKEEGHAVALLTNRSSIQQRNDVLNRLRKGQERILITTLKDVDIDQLTLVVNWDIPVDFNNEPDCQTYLHRIWRPGRFAQSGLTICFVDSQEAYDNMMRIQNHFKRIISELNTDDPDKIGKLQN
uniref:RNA helicase n=1 Tax=Amphimedon queenslandica TaxID=400682 RepID=A0A1X7TVE5_AMPQE